MWNENEFFDEFKKQNDNIKPSDDFKARLAATVQQESNPNIVAFNKKRNIRKYTSVAAAVAVLVVCGGVFGSMLFSGNKAESSVDQNIGVNAGSKNTEKTDDSETTEATDSESKGTYVFEAETVDVDAIVGEIHDGASVVKGSEALSQDQADAFAEELSKAKVLSAASDEDVEALYAITGSKEWVVEAYESGDMYVYVK